MQTPHTKHAVLTKAAFLDGKRPNCSTTFVWSSKKWGTPAKIVTTSGSAPSPIRSARVCPML